MLDLKSTMSLIEDLCNEMVNRINKNGDFIDSEVIEVSRKIDNALKLYNYLVNEEIRISMHTGMEAS